MHLVSECWRFNAMSTTRAIFMAKTNVKDLRLYSTATQNYWRWVVLRQVTQKIVLLR